MNQSKQIIFKVLFIMVLLLSALSVACPGAEIPTHKFMVSAGANLFRSSSAYYRQIYGQSAFMPEIKISCLVYHNFSVWGGFGLISKQGLIEEVDETAKINQTFLSFGVGVAHKLSAQLRLHGELGLAYISFKEEAFGGTLKGSGLGWKIGVNLDYFIGKKMFLTLATAYSQTSDEAQTGKIELGGAQIGAGVGIVF